MLRFVNKDDAKVNISITISKQNKFFLAIIYYLTL